MSKPISGLFPTTSGALGTARSPEAIIAGRSRGLDLREHPRMQKTLSAKQKRAIAEKVKTRTVSRQEYKALRSDERFAKRRKAGIREYWKQEKRRIKNGELTTRKWTQEQAKDILEGRVPRISGKPMQGHHSYSASRYPHLANSGYIIYPVIFEEHLYEWHGGNYMQSLPGKRIKRK